MTVPSPHFPPPPPRIKPPGTVVTSIAIFLSGCGLVLVAGGILMWINGAIPFSKNDNLRTSVSPDGKLQAVLFRRVSGLDDAITTEVAIIAAGKKLPNAPGTAFVARGEPIVLVHWTDNKNLVINEFDGSKVIVRAAQVGDVKISDR